LWAVLPLSGEGFSKTAQIFAVPGIVAFSSALGKIDRRLPGAGFNAFRALILGMYRRDSGSTVTVFTDSMNWDKATDQVGGAKPKQ